MIVSELKAEDYNIFYKTYIDKLGKEAELLVTLEKQLKNFPSFLKNIPKEKLQFAYAPEKWSVLETLVHIIDTERVFQYRALRFSRNDITALPGFDQDSYVPKSNANNRTIDSIIEEYIAVRSSTISLFSTFSDDALRHKGIASNAPMSVCALGFIICGHQRHHRDIIRERYL